MRGKSRILLLDVLLVGTALVGALSATYCRFEHLLFCHAWLYLCSVSLRSFLPRYTIKQDGRERAQVVFQWNEVRFVYCLKKASCLQTIRSPVLNNVSMRKCMELELLIQRFVQHVTLSDPPGTYMRIRVYTCTRYMYRYNAIIVSHYVIETKYVRMRIKFGRLNRGAHHVSQQRTLHCAGLNLTLFSYPHTHTHTVDMTRSCTGQSRKLLLHV